MASSQLWDAETPLPGSGGEARIGWVLTEWGYGAELKFSAESRTPRTVLMAVVVDLTKVTKPDASVFEHCLPFAGELRTSYISISADFRVFGQELLKTWTCRKSRLISVTRTRPRQQLA